MIVSYTQKRKLTIVYSLLNHDCTTFTSLENLLNENTVRTEGIQITLAHSWFNYYAPELVPMVYYRIKPRVQMFYSLNNDSTKIWNMENGEKYWKWELDITQQCGKRC